MKSALSLNAESQDTGAAFDDRRWADYDVTSLKKIATREARALFVFRELIQEEGEGQTEQILARYELKVNKDGSINRRSHLGLDLASLLAEYGEWPVKMRKAWLAQLRALKKQSQIGGERARTWRQSKEYA